VESMPPSTKRFNPGQTVTQQIFGAVRKRLMSHPGCSNAEQKHQEQRRQSKDLHRPGQPVFNEGTFFCQINEEPFTPSPNSANTPLRYGHKQTSA
jgi:hypothetical protein